MKSTIRMAVIGLLLIVSLLTPASALAGDPKVDDIAGELLCQCGDNKVLTGDECGTAQQMKQVIVTKLGEGQNKQQILDYFVAQYGEKVLSAPTKQGFNLTAWITPFIAIAAAAGVIILVLGAWVARGRLLQRETEEELEEEMPEEVADRYEERLSRELAEYEGGA